MQIDAAELQQDFSVLSVLLSAARLCEAEGIGLRVDTRIPAKLQELARVYGVDSCCGPS